MEEEVKGLGDYLDIIRRRKYWVIFPALILMAVSAGVANWLPATYKSEGIILIESQEIPADLIKSTVTSYADQRIEVIRQRLVTTAKVMGIVEKHNLYTEMRKKSPPSAIVGLFKENLAVDMVQANVTDPVSGRAKLASIAFKVSFMDKSPQVAQIIANELVTEFLTENVRTRTDRAAETTTFLKEEGDKFEKKVQQLEIQIAEFKDKYSDSLPELLEYNLSMVASLQEELAANQSQVFQLRDQVSTMTSELANMSAYIAQNPQAAQSPSQPPTLEIQLAELKTEYSNLLGRYSANHPDVKALKNKINALETELEQQTDSSVSPDKSSATKKQSALSPILLQYKSKINSTEREIIRLRNRQDQIRTKLADYEKRVVQTHQVTRAYTDMTRDYDNSQAKYKELRAKQLEAELGENLESENKGESFTLIEPPTVPSKAEKPNRPKIMAMGAVLSVGTGFGLALFIEMLFGGVRGYTEITRVVGRSPLVVIPVITTEQDIRKRKSVRNRWLLLLFVLCLALVASFHFFVMDLEVLWFKVMRKLSLL